MGQYTVRHQCDPKMCKYCRHFYWNTDRSAYDCKKAHGELVGRYAEACDDFKDRVIDRLDVLPMK